MLDTAPTGHTILLLDAALAYHREVTRQASGMPEAVEKLLPRLRDPEFTRVLIVTLPEATPVHEAAKLQEDLAAGRHPPVRLGDQPEPDPAGRGRPGAAVAAGPRGRVHPRGDRAATRSA